MNFTTILGIIFGVVLLFLAIAFGISGQEIWRIEEPWGIFVNLPGLFIVIGGTIAATFISYPTTQITRVFHSLNVVFKRESSSPKVYIKEITRMAALARNNTLILEQEVPHIRNYFLRDGIQMLADNFSPEEITEIMQQRIEFRTRKEQEESHVFRTMARFSPSFGMIGTLIGLIGMLANMGTDETLGKIGGDMAVALVTTFYGLILANLFFNPFANKLENRTRDEIETMRMIQESIRMISESWHHRKVEDYLNSFVRPAERIRSVIGPRKTYDEPKPKESDEKG